MAQNLLQVQDDLRGLPSHQIEKYLADPTSIPSGVPYFMVLTQKQENDEKMKAAQASANRDPIMPIADEQKMKAQKGLAALSMQGMMQPQVPPQRGMQMPPPGMGRPGQMPPGVQGYARGGPVTNYQFGGSGGYVGRPAGWESDPVLRQRILERYKANTYDAIPSDQDLYYGMRIMEANRGLPNRGLEYTPPQLPAPSPLTQIDPAQLGRPRTGIDALFTDTPTGRWAIDSLNPTEENKDWFAAPPPVEPWTSYERYPENDEEVPGVLKHPNTLRKGWEKAVKIDEWLGKKMDELNAWLAAGKTNEELSPLLQDISGGLNGIANAIGAGNEAVYSLFKNANSALDAVANYAVVPAGEQANGGVVPTAEDTFFGILDDVGDGGGLYGIAQSAEDFGPEGGGSLDKNNVPDVPFDPALGDSTVGGLYDSISAITGGKATTTNTGGPAAGGYGIASITGNDIISMADQIADYTGYERDAWKNNPLYGEVLKGIDSLEAYKGNKSMLLGNIMTALGQGISEKGLAGGGIAYGARAGIEDIKNYRAENFGIDKAILGAKQSMWQATSALQQGDTETAMQNYTNAANIIAENRKLQLAAAKAGGKGIADADKLADNVANMVKNATDVISSFTLPPTAPQAGEEPSEAYKLYQWAERVIKTYGPYHEAIINTMGGGTFAPYMTPPAGSISGSGVPQYRLDEARANTGWGG